MPPYETIILAFDQLMETAPAVRKAALRLNIDGTDRAIRGAQMVTAIFLRILYDPPTPITSGIFVINGFNPNLWSVTGSQARPTQRIDWFP